MSIELGRRLIASGAVSPEEIEAALFFSVARGVPFTRALIDRGAISASVLEEELGRVGGLALRQVAGAPDLFARLPKAMCRRLAAIPTRADPVTGTIDVAVADPLDPHVTAEFGFHLGAPVRVLRAPIAAIEEEIRRIDLDDASPPLDRPRTRRATPPFPHGAPASSLPPPEEPIPLVRKQAAHTETIPVGRDPAARTPEAPRVVMRDPSGAPTVSFPSQPPDPMPKPPSTRRWGNAGSPAAPPNDLDFDRTSPVPAAPAESRKDRGTLPYLGIVPAASPSSPSSHAHDPQPEARPTSKTLPAPSGPDPEIAPALEPPSEPDPEPPPVKPRLRAPDGSAVLAALREAESRDAIVRQALLGMRLAAQRFAVFAVKRDGYQGWACNAAFGDAEALKGVMVPAEQPSVLATAVATGSYLGPIPATTAHEALLAVMEQASNDVSVIAVRAGGRTAMILLADELEDTMMGTRFLSELAAAIGEALARLLAR